LFRRFDDVISYDLPKPGAIRRVIESRLGAFNTDELDWAAVLAVSEGLSQADITRACLEAAKTAVLSDTEQVSSTNLLDAIGGRRQSRRA
jgi:SpoVK/Ycf46/Vps4 family AAA+-type ATPase